MEFEITWKRSVRIWWAWLWRSFITLVVAFVIVVALGFGIGFVIGFIMSKLGFQTETIVFISSILGYIFGCVAILIGLLLPLKMILGKDFGEFRLVLLAKDTSGTTSQTR
jgi:ABC-type uncharacterized transport system permease subunit